MDEKPEMRQGMPPGHKEAWADNIKMIVADELGKRERHESQENRAVEEALKTQARINEIAMQSLQAFTHSMDERQKDTRHIGIRKELDAEERMAELEETFNKAIQAVSEINAGTNSLIEMVGLLKGELAAKD